MQSEQTVPEFPACSLAQAPHRQPWRKRGAIEVEDIVVLQPDCPAGGRIIWVDYSSNEIPYTVLHPGQRAVYRSWEDHCWIARDVQSGRRLCINGAQAVIAHTTDGHTATITQPPLLCWDQHAGAAFPQQFRREASTLLLCWRRLGAASPQSSASSGDSCDGCPKPADLGALDFGLVMHIIRQHLAPATLWQEACLPPACHRDILPTQLHCLAGFDTMMKHTMLNCDVRGGELLRSRMSTDQLARSVLPPPPGAAPSSAVQELTSVLSGFFAALIGGS
ncbi:hypothetical protein D9Q98_003598 [Chlorella vulgaris]|uniref:von Hippel-Lindau disease tumour suppressor beta domain-containing protein n=1 Tax=Chlorella vulgaris TaxID=3077 RepID=A0A9D4TTG8_CHLVU|nr:hypothetical protein D9Q98_003598 [Chlorella vulgaris]